MGKGTNLARDLGATVHADLLDDLKEQLLIVFLKRLGGTADVPVAEVDDTGQDNFAFLLDTEKRMFHFEIRRKS